MEFKTLNLALQRLVSYSFIRISLHTGCFSLQKLMQKIEILTRAWRRTVAGLLIVFVVNGAGVRRATYLCLDSTMNVNKNWDINVSFIIHVNFDHVWAEHYPVTLILAVCMVNNIIQPKILAGQTLCSTQLPSHYQYMADKFACIFNFKSTR